MLTFRSVLERDESGPPVAPTLADVLHVDALDRAPTRSGNVSRQPNVRSLWQPHLAFCCLPKNSDSQLTSPVFYRWGKGWYCKAQGRVVALFFAILNGCCAPRVGRRLRVICCFCWARFAAVFFLTSYVHRVATARNSDVGETLGRYLYGEHR
jgi:hypothetical protein